MYKYVDQKGSVAILSVKSPAGVAPEVNLRNPLHAGEEAHRQHIHILSLKRRADVARSPKQGSPVP